MANLGFIGYQLYSLPQGLFVVGPEVAESLFKKSKDDVRSILNTYLEEATEEDLFLDHKINKGILIME